MICQRLQKAEKLAKSDENAGIVQCIKSRYSMSYM